MYSLKYILTFAVLFIGVHSRYIYKEDYIPPPPRYVLEEFNVLNDDNEDAVAEHSFESVQPRYIRLSREAQEENIEPANFYQDDGEDLQQSHIRIARQAHGNVELHVPSGTVDVSGGVPLAGNSKNALSAVGSVQGIKPGGFGSAGAGLHLDNVNGHGLTVMGSHVPDLGNQLTAAGKLNLVHTPNHNLDANAFASRTFSNQPNLPNFNTYGGGLDYMYKGKVGASVGATTFPAFGRTDYSAMGKLNVFKTPSSSIDFSSGIHRMNTPFFSRTEPRFDLTFSRSF